MQTIQSGQEYQDEKFEQVCLEAGQVLSADFLDCSFSGCTFAGALLINCRFNNCLFKDCDLSLAEISGSSFPSTRFEGVKLVGIDWTRAAWNGLGIGVPPVFDSCVLNYSTFIGVNLKGSGIENCTIREADFREADLGDVRFGKSDLVGSIFGDTNLSGADLSRAKNYTIDPASNELKNAMFSLPEALALLYSMDIILEDSGSTAR